MMNRIIGLILLLSAISFTKVQAQCPTIGGTTITSTNETCPGASDGSLLLVFTDPTAAPPRVVVVVNLATGFVSPALYTKTETANSVLLSGLPTGNYAISVIDVTIPCVTPFINGGAGFNIGIDPYPILQTGQAKTICSGENVDYEILLNPVNDPAGTLFNWAAPTMSDGSTQGTAGNNVPADPAGTLHITDNLVNLTGAPITATYTVTPVLGTCAATPEDVVITIDAAPVIVPSQTKTICGGEGVDYEVLLQPLNSPAGTIFNWPAPVLSDGSVQGSAGINVSADPAGTLHITDVIQNMGNSDITATYTITPTQGCVGVPTDIVVTIEPTPVIQPGQVKTICSSDPVDLEILLSTPNTPSGSFFNWNLPVMSDGSVQGSVGSNVAADPAGTVHITDVLINTTGADITATYTVVPINGSCPGVPEDVVITITAAPVVVAGQGSTICSGFGVDYEILLNPLNTPAGVTFNWPVPVMSDGSVQGTAGVNVAADPAGTLHITDILVNRTGAPITATYTVTPTNGSCAGLAEDLIFTIDPEPVILPGQAKSICSGEAADYEILLSPLNAPAGSVLNWGLPVMSDGSIQGSVGVNVAADPAGAIHITDVLTNSSGIPITATYTITATSASGCLGAAEDVVITIESAPVITAGQGSTICSGQNANFEILLSPLNLPVGTLFNWPLPVMSDGSSQGSPGVNVSADPAGTFHITDAFINLTGTPITATYTITPSNGACIGIPEQVVFTIDPAPVVSPGQTKTVCSNDPVNLEILLTPVNSPPGTLLNWPLPVMSDGSVQGTVGVNVAADPAGTIHINDVLVNLSGAPITATYSVTPSNGLCIGQAQDILVVIDPQPVVQAGQTKSICSGDPVDLEILLNPLNLPAGSLLNWPVPAMSDGSVQGSSGANVSADPAGTIHLTDVLINNTPAPIIATYSVTATSGTCNGATEDIVITIVPNPTDVGIVEAPTQEICEGIDQTVTLASSEIGINYEVLVDGATSGLPIVTGDGSANLLIGTLSGLTTGGYTISVIASVGSCQITLTDNVSLTVDGVPSSTITGPASVCENTTETYSAPLGATSYVWSLIGGDGTITSGQGTEAITVDWATAGGDVALSASGPAPAFCTSNSTLSVGVFGVTPQLPDEIMDVCQFSGVPTLSTTPLAGAIVNWYLGTVNPADLRGTGDNFTPDPADLNMDVPGTTNFLFTQDIGCGESLPANYAVNVLSIPDAGGNGSDQVCDTSPNLDLFTLLTGTPDIGGVWFDDDNSGAMSPAGIFDPAIAGIGIFNFTYEVVGVGACAGIDPTAVVTVNVTAGSGLPIPDQPSYTACTFGAPPTLSVTGINILWYSDAALTNQVGSGPTYTPIANVDIDMNIPGSTPFYATQNDGCGESSGVQIQVILEGVSAELGEVNDTYPEQNIGSIQIIDITSDDPPMDIILLDNNGGVVQDWSPVTEGVGDSFTYFYDQLGAGTYEVVIQDAVGCEISLFPVIDFNTDVFIPNVFTPNGDSYNDRFTILNIQVNTKIEINNRWGVRVFSSDDYQNDWQADGLSDGFYYYTVNMNGAIYKGYVEVWRGNQ